VVAADAAQGRAAVQTLKKRGVDFIKVHSKLPRDAYFAIVDEARKQGLAVAGHVPESVSAGEASDAGQRSFEHLTGIWTSCCDDERRLREEATRQLRSGKPGDLSLLFRVLLGPIDRYSESRAKALYPRLAKQHTWQTPTLVVYRALCSLDDERFTTDSRLQYAPSFLRGFWDPKTPQNQDLIRTAASLKQSFRRALEEVGRMHRAGVELLAGTDTPFPFCFPGFGVHDELALLVKAGLTPMEALQTATRNPARYFGRLVDQGTIEQGKLADLVLLNADPLIKIENTQRIWAVIVRGKILRRTDLDRLLAGLKRDR
jgi:hypothetical protein